MSAQTCCRRSAEVVGWLLPGATLALLPKCPACVAAYIALLTGVGISMSAAAYLRTALLIVCVSSLFYLVARRVKKWTLRNTPCGSCES